MEKDKLFLTLKTSLYDLPPDNVAQHIPVFILKTKEGGKNQQQLCCTEGFRNSSDPVYSHL